MTQIEDGARTSAHSQQYTDAAGRLHDAVVKVAHCSCRLAADDWLFARALADRIDQNWIAETRDNPAFFDGIVLLTKAYEINSGACGHAADVNATGKDAVSSADALSVVLFETRFRNYLLWRREGFRDAGAIDGFGSAIVRSADGAILLVRQLAGNVNEGLSYFPSGFIDRRDVDADGSIDISASIARELSEEVGLQAQDLTRQPGFIVTRAGPHLSIGVVYDSPLTAKALSERIQAYLGRTTDREIETTTFVREKADLKTLVLAPHCAVLLGRLL